MGWTLYADDPVNIIFETIPIHLLSGLILMLNSHGRAPRTLTGLKISPASCGLMGATAGCLQPSRAFRPVVHVQLYLLMPEQY